MELFRDEDGTYSLATVPAPETKALRAGKAMKYGSFSAGTKKVAKKLPVANKGICEIVLELNTGSAEIVYITLANAKGEETVMSYDPAKRIFSMDRTRSGLTGFSKDFPAVTEAPCPKGNKQTLRLFVDRCSIEAFEGEGRFAMTNLVFPEEPYTTVAVSASKGTCKVNNLIVYPLNVNK